MELFQHKTGTGDGRVSLSVCNYSLVWKGKKYLLEQHFPIKSAVNVT